MIFLLLIALFQEQAPSAKTLECWNRMLVPDGRDVDGLCGELPYPLPWHKEACMQVVADACRISNQSLLPP